MSRRAAKLLSKAGRMLFLTVALMTWVYGGLAHADNGPHTGDFTPTTDACAGCHRAHRGQTDTLLVQATQQALCFSCHGSAAPGANTNVVDGVDESGVFPYNGLRGGGFVNALMDTKHTGTPVLAPVTSKHNVGEPGQTIWGLGGGGVGHTTSSSRPTIDCSTCHNVHGFRKTDSYRVLRAGPICTTCHDVHRSADGKVDVSDPGSHARAGITDVIPDENPKVYTIQYFASGDRAGFRDDTYLDGKGISTWCTRCHTRYLSDGAASTGDPVYAHRHMANDTNLKCMACHVAHGTSATMDTISGEVEWPDNTAGGGASDSRLLTVDNRGVCYQCHPAP